MEGSKAFAKDFMARCNIPTAEYRTFTTYETARSYVENVSHAIVLKASGLAAGKGVIIPSTKEEAYSALNDIMLKKEFGAAGDEVVIEEYLEGEELSFLTFSDGYTLRSLPPAQDHKPVFDDDKGPNTGGMGCYGPPPIATPALCEEVHRTILEPTVRGMRREREVINILQFAFADHPRISVCWSAIYWDYGYREWAQSSRIQCSLR